MIFLDTTVLVGAIDRTDVRHPDGAAVIRAVEDEAHKALSFTDASTVAAMRRGGIRVLYSHDTDFDSVRGVERRERP
ncbi:MAG: hypothetical protein QXT68_08130 [Halobacteria archaeon]